ncbi:hypothetical protein [Desulfogranum marinum]|uniref:hypothetical protein n=1 Tax=Desulfogranum marinum TaxID=453220 RepID=UPI001963BF42|nr:hypothetical protein [Desulfogranum marinum]MBM9513149.1 hypothetical protein [Desulfogranum marinum]
MIIEKALDTYRTILALMTEIEQLLPGQDIERMLEKYQQMMHSQDEAKELDQKILNLLNTVSDPTGSTKILDLLDLMQKIQDTNHRLTPQMQAIMAVQKNELNKLNQGSNMMRRYHSHTRQTGQLVSNAG